MDPVTAGYFALASVKLVASLAGNKAQAKAETAQIKLQTEQARLQAAEQTYERTKMFRQNISQNLALSGIGIGGVSGFRGIAAESISDYFQDAKSLTNQDVFAQLSGNANKALSKSNNLLKNVSALESSASLADKLGLFKSGAKKSNKKVV